MANDLKAPQLFNKQEPIPGYITKDLLGTGGYGEVWKCQAPGGLFKAVKFIYADAHSKRAAGELRSLNRIKEVRHPFLLSIERIEVIDGNVVIVTELADYSLKRQFQKHKSKGLPGIPREELLGYLRDAADALDFIYDNYSLQHLDIKPENLLLVGNRAKVADFGLVRNLYDRSASMVEGLTPIYASPELFEGKPNRHSDQYSLAIVFEEMLTGDVPFDGASPAQLAAQHLHMAPAISALPKYDQSVIARALSKDPAQRFANCRALVEALVDAGKTKCTSINESVKVRERTSQTPPDALYGTQALEGDVLANAAIEATAFQQLPLDRQLSPIDFDAQCPMQYEPVLFVGIGGTATRVLRRLRRRIHDRMGPIDSIPSIEMLLIDTDIKGLNRATDGEYGSAIDGNERLPVPLRRSEDYRSGASSAFASVSRRWLFNVPYNLETDGFRPLGRLAMLDHSKRLLDRLRQSLIKITSEENAAKTKEATGMEFVSGQPRVFIFASTSGGTGSGMVIDVAYAVRSILAKLDLPDAHVHGILMHSTGCGPRDHDKAVANTYATLNELWHYSRPGKCYPGDRGCGLPPFHGNNRTFASCYFVHLGDDLNELQLDVATDPVAEYLYSTTMTPAARFLDQCRQMENVRWGNELREPLLRTFGLCQIGGSNSEIPTIVAELLCRDLVLKWRGGLQADAGHTAPLLSMSATLALPGKEARNPAFAGVDSQAAARAVELGIDLEQMRGAARDILDKELSTDAEIYFQKLIAEAQARSNGQGAAVVAAIDSALTGSDEDSLDSLNAVLNIRIEGKAAQLATSICDWVFELVDEDEGVAGAQRAAEWFQSHLRDLQATMIAATGRVREDALTCQHALLRANSDEVPSNMRLWGRKKQAHDVESHLRDYARAQIEQALSCSVTRWLRLVEAQVNAELDRLQTFWKDLSALASKFQVSQSIDDAFEHCGGSEGVPNHWRQLLGDLVKQRSDLVVALNSEIETKLAVGSKKLRWFLSNGRQIDVQLVPPLREAARQLILAAMQDLNQLRLAGSSEGPLASPDYHDCIKAAHPRICDEGLGSRLFVILPQMTDEAAVRQMLMTKADHDAAIIHSAGSDFIACREAELLEVRRVAATLIDNRRDFVEIAKRLHTRIDVNWDEMPLNSKSQSIADSRLAARPMSEVSK